MHIELRETSAFLGELVEVWRLTRSAIEPGVIPVHVICQKNHDVRLLWRRLRWVGSVQDHQRREQQCDVEEEIHSYGFYVFYGGMMIAKSSLSVSAASFPRESRHP